MKLLIKKCGHPINYKCCCDSRVGQRDDVLMDVVAMIKLNRTKFRKGYTIMEEIEGAVYERI